MGSSSFPSCPAHFLLFSPQLPYDNERVAWDGNIYSPGWKNITKQTSKQQQQQRKQQQTRDIENLKKIFENIPSNSQTAEEKANALKGVNAENLDI